MEDAWTPPLEVQVSERRRVLFDRDFVREQKSRCTIGELNQIHRTVQIPDLAQNCRLFTKSRAPFVVAHGSEQSALPPGHFSYFALAHHFSTSFSQFLPGSSHPRPSGATRSKQRA